MSIQSDIKAYIASLSEAKQADIQTLQKSILKIQPKCKVWFLDGKNEQGKVVTNPNIGFGSYTIKYADGKTKEFYRVGLTANTAGISVYIMGHEDKTHLAKNYGKKIGKADVTGYCIKFKALKDIKLDVLEEAMRERLEQ